MADEVVGGAASGAAAGSSFGPWGAAFGALYGISQGSKARKAGEKAGKESLRAARDAELLNRERYGIAAGLMSPYIDRSNIASQQLMAELGLPQAPQQYMGQGEQQPISHEDYLAFKKPEYDDFYPGEYRRDRRPQEKEYKEALEDWQFRMDAREASGQPMPGESPYMGGEQTQGPANNADYEYKARDISEIPGYQAAMDESLGAAEQSAVSSGSTAYGGRRLEAAGEVGAGVQQSYYNNYMNMLQNMANPTAATNLSSMGMNQGISMGQQNIAATNAASNYRLQGVAAQNAAGSDVMGGLANMYGSYMDSGGGGGNSDSGAYRNEWDF